MNQTKLRNKVDHKKYLKGRFGALVFAESGATFDIGSSFQEQFGNVQLTLDGRVGQRRPVLGLGVGVSPRMGLGAGDGWRFGVHVGAGIQENFGQSLVSADGGQHQRRQSVFADRVNLLGREF